MFAEYTMFGATLYHSWTVLGTTCIVFNGVFLRGKDEGILGSLFLGKPYGFLKVSTGGSRLLASIISQENRMNFLWFPQD